MRILRASEDYLEAMLMMKNKHGYIRSIDVAEHLGVTKPSVSFAVKKLKENNLITMDKSGFITLTDSGMEIAECMLERHTVISKMLLRLGVSQEIADADACRIEHDISEETFAELVKHLNKND